MLDFLDGILGSRWWDLLIVKLGAGALVLAVITGAWAWFSRRKDRGRDLIDTARPDLVPVGNMSPRGQFCIRVENHGPGRAHNLRLRFTGTPGEASGGDLAPGKTGITQTLDVSQNPALSTAQESLALTVVCADRFGNDYTVALPVAQTLRADRAYNLDVPSWNAYQATAPSLGWRVYFRVGK